ncbi:MAG: hypothetical protein ACKOJ7_07625 [Betaproteobacteria bacterium]
MIQSLDPVGPGQRLDPIFLEGRGPLINAEQARSLGLQNGQVVQAVIDREGSTFSVLWPAGQRIGLPRALEAFPLPSQWRWAPGSLQELVALLMPGGFIQLRPVKTAPHAGAQPPAQAQAPGAGGSAGQARADGASAATSTPAALQAAAAKGSAYAAAAGLPTGGRGGSPAPAYSLGQAFALAQGLLPGAGASAAANPAALAPPPGASAELARLLQQAPAWSALLKALAQLLEAPTAAEPDEPSGVPASPLARLVDLLGGALPRMGQLTPAALQQAIARSGLGTEAALLAGAAVLDQDLKVALRRLQRGLPGGPTELVVGRAVDTLERAQIDSLTAQMQGQLLLSMVIPFGDAGPVALRLFRERAKREDEPPPFVVDMHSGHSPLGPLWLRTLVAPDRRVALTMWALRPDVAEQAREQSRELRLNLSQSGLVLSSLDIVTGAPASDERAWAQAGGAA